MSSENSATRDAIFDAGLRLLSTEGHESLTVRRIATEAGCSTIGVYTWFGGKDGLIDAIWRSGFESFADALESARALKAPLSQARGQAKAYRTWALSHPMHYQVMFMKAMPGFTPTTESQVASGRAFQSLLNAVNDAHTKGELRSPDITAVAMTMWAAIHGLVSLELVGTKPEVVTDISNLAERSFRVLIDALVRGLTVDDSKG